MKRGVGRSPRETHMKVAFGWKGQRRPGAVLLEPAEGARLRPLGVRLLAPRL